MRAFGMERRFGFIFIARNSLLHLSSTQDIVATFRAVRRHLVPGGMFVLDIFNPDPAILARPADRRFPVRRVENTAFGRLTVEGCHDYDAAAQVDRGTWFILTEDERDKWVVPVVVRSILPQELPLLLEAGGVRLLDRFGNLAEQPFGGRARSRSASVEQRPEPLCCENVLVMGVATLYLFTCDRQGFYKRLGWSELEEAKYAGRFRHNHASEPRGLTRRCSRRVADEPRSCGNRVRRNTPDRG
jgi:hypothetical protein